VDLLADTVFLIDLWREAGSPGRATAFARANASKQLAICWVVAGEFLGGAVAAGQDIDMVRAFLSRYPVLNSDAAVIRAYAAANAELRAARRMIGPNDLWVAATAKAHALPLITRNAEEFRRVEGVTVVAYSMSTTTR
jgi:tRNA(fMet)-specific endonuclease VapC